MFTGIIEEVGKVTSIKEEREHRRLMVAASKLRRRTEKRRHIAVSGVCLTAVEITPDSFCASTLPTKPGLAPPSRAS